MIDIEFDEEIRRAAPGLRVIVLEADVRNSYTPDEFWNLLGDLAADVRNRYALDMVNRRPAIAATRAAYKALGKEPNRYRPSAEALCRRAVKGMELYRITSLVDIINYISMYTGYSIGGFDADRVEGKVLRLGRGQAGEPFEGIGRGMLNIEGLPVYRDSAGGIGTPTSDNERTKISEDTRRLLMIVNMYATETPEDETIELSTRLLHTFADASNITIRTFTP